MSTTTVDPVTFEVIWHRLLDISEEMGIKYIRTSASPVVVGGYDAATGITLPDGQIVAIGPYITTQGTVLGLMVQHADRMCRHNPGIGPADMFIINDPYLAATHQSDVGTVAPVFYDGKLVAWVGSSGHWLDIGGPEPGSLNMKAHTVWEEGLRLPPVRIVEGGRVREDLVRMIMNQIRDPLAEFDLRGQIVANKAGVDRLVALFDRYGVETVQDVMRGAIGYVERRLRARLRELPDGVWRQVQFLDHNAQAPTLHRILCTITKEGDRLQVDFTGTDLQTDGYINCTYAGLRAATLAAIFIQLAWDLPWNEGIWRCVDLVAPPGTVCTARAPAPVALSTISSIIVSLSCVYAALSRMLLASDRFREEATANWSGTSLAPVICGFNDRGQYTVHQEASHFAQGCGARTYRDGVDTGGIIVNTTASIPAVELTEAQYPQIYLFRRQLIDSGGPGRYRGGLSAGLALAPYRGQGEQESSFGGTGAEGSNAFGVGGGMPGAAARFLRFAGTSTPTRLREGRPLPRDLNEVDGERQVHYLKFPRSPLPADMVEYHSWQGGGGFGDPLERLPAQVAEDVASGAVSAECAHRIYGVVLTEAGEAAEAATGELRARLRRERIARARPVAEALPPPPAGELPPLVPRRAGVLCYGDMVEFHLGTDRCTCMACGQHLGPARGWFPAPGCLVEEAPVEAAGPVRGEDYSHGRITLRLYYCPGCGRQLECEVALKGSPQAGFLLASPPGSG